MTADAGGVWAGCIGLDWLRVGSRDVTFKLMGWYIFRLLVIVTLLGAGIDVVLIIGDVAFVSNIGNGGGGGGGELFCC